MPERLILFVCTGNICRSPMAEYMLRARLDPAAGWSVGSAGLFAGQGMPASAAAIDVLAAEGIDLAPHRSRQLTAELVDAADVVVVMTAGHREQMRVLFPRAMGKVFLLKSFGGQAGDVVDPIGQLAAAYRRVREEVAAALPELIGFLGQLETE